MYYNPVGGREGERVARRLDEYRKCFKLSFEMSKVEAIEQVPALMEGTFSTHDGQEGVRAFFAKEEAKYRHS
ncbi:MAG: hypothetical protein O2967_20115 [Proteobacteria bacterium]|nr:hypothetical protein [Pseudomonadota bacterium]